MLSTVTVIFAVLLVGIQHGVERPSLSAAICHVVTSNGVTVCGSKFPPTVSKHCPHQHSAIPKTIQQFETPSIQAHVITQDSISSVQHHGSFCS